jgi:hypothetical protein
MAAKGERTKYELLCFDDFPIAAALPASRRRSAHLRMATQRLLWRPSHCPFAEPMFNVATFLRTRMIPKSGYRFSDKIMRKREAPLNGS